MTLFMSGLLLLTSFIWLVQCSQLKVVSLGNGKLGTFVASAKFDSITYEKRYKNATVSTELHFEVKYVTSLVNVISFTWLFNGYPLDVPRSDFTTVADSPDIFSSEQYYDLQKSAKVTLHLRNAALVPGNYTIIVTLGHLVESASGLVVSAPILPYFHKPKRVLEGDIFHIICSVEGYPKPNDITWLFAPIPVGQTEDDGALTTALHNLQPMDFNTTRYSQDMSPGGEMYDALFFSDLLIEDNGLYACNASNSEGSDISLVLVNVKDRWAAVWPFVGIVVEVSVLVAAILLYERHQMRSKPTTTTSTEVPTVNQQTPTGKSTVAATNNTVGGGEYLSSQQQTAGNKLVTVVQPPNPVESKEGTATFGCDAVGVAEDRNYDDQKQDELRLRGGTTKC